MATIRKRIGQKAGKRTTSWQVTVRRGDHKPQYRTFATKGEAEKWARAVESAIDRDEYTPSPEGKRRTLREMLERYRETELPKKRDAVNEHRYLDFWIEELGDYKIASVTRAQIVEIRDRMAKSRAPATCNRYLATLRHAFRLASTDWEWVAHSPCTKLALREPRGRDRHLSDEEIDRLLKAVRENRHPHLYAITLVALTTGARRGEILGLRWREVDLPAGRAVLHRTKNADKRTLVLVPQVVDELTKLRKVRRIDTDEVFCAVNAEGKRTFPRFDDAWKQARAAAGLHDFRFHDLRHTFASRMAMNGCTLAEIAAALGHRTLAMVQRYAHIAEGHAQAAAERTALKVMNRD